MSWFECTNINAVLGEEFDELLSKLGIREAFVRGEYNCKICGQAVTTDNVLLIFPVPHEEVGFVCRKPECIIEYSVSTRD